MSYDYGEQEMAFGRVWSSAAGNRFGGAGGLMVDFRLQNAADNKTGVVTSVGQVFTIDIYAVVKGADTNTRNEGITSVQGNIQSWKLAGVSPAATGALSVNGDEMFDADGNSLGFGLAMNPFNQNGYQLGKSQDLPPTEWQSGLGRTPQ